MSPTGLYGVLKRIPLCSSYAQFFFGSFGGPELQKDVLF